MKSPFPGMDPYLERYWRDLHQSLIIYTATNCRTACRRNFAPGSRNASTWRRLPTGDAIFIQMCMLPNTPMRGWGRNDAGCGQCCRGERVVITINDEPITESFIEIREAGSDNRVVTIIRVP